MSLLAWVLIGGVIACVLAALAAVVWLTKRRPAAAVQPDRSQIFLGKDFFTALRDVGVLPDEVYARRKCAIHIDSDDAVYIAAELYVPLDKLRAALDIVASKQR